MAQSNADMEERNKAAVEDRFAAWAAGTASPFDLLAPDAAWTIAGRSMVAKTYGSREAFMRDVIRPFNARMQKGARRPPPTSACASAIVHSPRGSARFCC